jgi:hypothetical protein
MYEFDFDIEDVTEICRACENEDPAVCENCKA